MDLAVSPDAAAPEQRSPPQDARAGDDPIDAIWDAHFRAPAAAAQRARAALEDTGADERTRAWAELTTGWHQLYFTSEALAAATTIPAALERFVLLGERRGELLARIGAARLALMRQLPHEAREQVLAIYDEAYATLPPQDRFWAINVLAATYFYDNRIDEAIRYLHLALETLRTIDVSPHLATAMSNLAASLVTVGDYAPARELAQDAIEMLTRYDNPQVLLFARSNLAEAELGTGDRDSALATVDAMFAEAPTPMPSQSQAHFMAIGAEVYALYGASTMPRAACARPRRSWRTSRAATTPSMRAGPRLRSPTRATTTRSRSPRSTTRSRSPSSAARADAVQGLRRSRGAQREDRPLRGGVRAARAPARRDAGADDQPRERQVFPAQGRSTSSVMRARRATAPSASARRASRSTGSSSASTASSSARCARSRSCRAASPPRRCTIR
jgi:tetratricopeptide (TPR) repeat protein